MGRAPCCDKASVKKGPWSPEEDAQLKAYIAAHGTGGNWIALPRKIGLKRCGKSCRLRWLNYLRPNIRHGGFSEEEDRVICSLYISIGSRWSTIAAQLPGRTDNDVKNYWNTKLKKRLLRRSEDASPSQPRNGFLLTNYYGSGKLALPASAIERMQLQMQLQQGQESAVPYYYNPALLWPKLSVPPVSVQSNLDGGTPALSTSAETVGVESSSSTVSSAAMGIEEEIDVLLHQMKCFGEMDETVVDGNIICSWSSCSTDLGVDSVFQDYVQGYSNQ